MEHFIKMNSYHDRPRPLEPFNEHVLAPVPQRVKKGDDGSAEVGLLWRAAEIVEAKSETGEHVCGSQVLRTLLTSPNSG
jgi:hypothetical protein